jgi:pyruvate formate lyase activating enzyme
MSGTIFDIQHYAVHDGPGIRTLVFLKGCPLHCAWCCNPESQSFSPQLRYMASRCTGCLACMEVCSAGAITRSENTLSHSVDVCLACTDKPCVDACNYSARSVSGKTMTAEEVCAIVARDIPFYLNSGGGVTFSGGEPMSQPGFLSEMLLECRNQGISTAVETCGWATPDAVRQALPLTDLFLFDLKIIDPGLHRQYTGRNIEPVLATLSLLASVKANLVIRLPLVRGITDTARNLNDIAGIMAGLDLRHITLEPYHPLGVEKYEAFGIPCALPAMEHYPPEETARVREFFERRGFVCG